MSIYIQQISEFFPSAWKMFFQKHLSVSIEVFFAENSRLRDMRKYKNKDQQL